jgi:hypothetical protein
METTTITSVDSFVLAPAVKGGSPPVPLMAIQEENLRKSEEQLEHELRDRATSQASVVLASKDDVQFEKVEIYLENTAPKAEKESQAARGKGNAFSRWITSKAKASDDSMHAIIGLYARDVSRQIDHWSLAGSNDASSLVGMCLSSSLCTHWLGHLGCAAIEPDRAVKPTRHCYLSCHRSKPGTSLRHPRRYSARHHFRHAGCHPAARRVGQCALDLLWQPSWNLQPVSIRNYHQPAAPAQVRRFDSLHASYPS